MTTELLSLDNIQEIARQYGYWAVFLGIALENTGIPLPGETITIVGGFLAGSGELNVWWVGASAIAGAVLGDNLGYWIGKIGGWKFLVKLGHFFRISDENLEQTRKKFLENAPRAVFFGRFVTLLRIFAGPMAGIVQMPYLKFFLCNLGGAVVWASTIVMLSFFLGQLMPLPQLVAWMTKLGIGALGLVIVWLLAMWYWQSRKRTLGAE